MQKGQQFGEQTAYGQGANYDAGKLAARRGDESFVCLVQRYCLCIENY